MPFCKTLQSRCFNGITTPIGASLAGFGFSLKGNTITVKNQHIVNGIDKFLGKTLYLDHLFGLSISTSEVGSIAPIGVVMLLEALIMKRLRNI